MELAEKTQVQDFLLITRGRINTIEAIVVIVDHGMSAGWYTICFLVPHGIYQPQQKHTSQVLMILYRQPWEQDFGCKTVSGKKNLQDYR